MREKNRHVIRITNMSVREKRHTTGASRPAQTTSRGSNGGITFSERLLRDCAVCTALMLCVLSLGNIDQPVASMSAQRLSEVVTTDFSPDEVLGKLQFVQNLLPESVLVFWNDTQSITDVFSYPCMSSVVHSWSESEPWIEYACHDTVSAAQKAEVMSVTRLDDDSYTVRLLHDNDTETIYSGLSSCFVAERDLIEVSQSLGLASGALQFEMRRHGQTLDPTDLLATP